MRDVRTFGSGAGLAGVIPLFLMVVAVGLLGIPQPPLVAQKAPRMNRMIEALESGGIAITGETWTWVEQEHQPYNIEKLGKALTTLLGRRNAQGQVALAPFVRIPMEGDQQSRWAIKQVLELGAMGIIIPQVENAQQALTIVQSMRYPQRTGSKYLEPRGRRGCCVTPAGWMLANPSDYFEKLADVWPLNPEGELFALLMIETPEGVKNVNEIVGVPGVGGLIVGPADLGMNLGYGGPGPGPRAPGTEAAIEKVLTACAAAKKYCGMVEGTDIGMKKYRDMGARFFYAPAREGASYSPNANH